MAVIFQRPNALKDVSMHYCPGCTHGIAHRLVAEVLDELGIEGKTVGISSVGCSYNSYDYFSCDMIQAPHGRAPAVATGVKRCKPDCVVFTYQGDGDLAAIGTAEIVHAAARGENITVIFINNTIYGMTSGQMAPTTLLNQFTTTTPYGRIAELHGFPINVCEMLATLQGPTYIERASLHDVKHIKKAKEAIKKAFKVQLAKLGFSLVELLSTCPTNWGLSPVESMTRIEKEMIPQYPIGVFKGENLEV
ncbi:ketoisovalerate oxidoreductase subunit VorA [Thermoclostridium stercorarium subsp. stercorarium DSM 8532]|jgi:2-oxoglutarate ferredoxin oxidoreductase subunit beta|uniref:Ketoisovalerate oxidoreductase subunit VorA n=3 Tax=Thermoclostridium stercorarium TaxID=1510 RepID=L7VP73_THES1|nr:thiamine pyrophosphate-dependent enzyme [Thermoclostridium stercorarium]AGC68241.1 ketoisovalerate oxidoreductase subunit VorA [Thermoclostridium stercorarium subsp. stercorarium DSM 8532]AGI39268.1 pyruvate-ferredoxin oxidoreductase beta subunit [Thermoclostridium stercorarium subsp. stercorarium DSM 8532]ANW98603.1 2-oxoglutarate oxidoreductase [Thermoclostridium stercorarium subsp. thermolacticum DSM 2910]ANX01145.1 2-oxoglutarate oxidoreductase [Thermoclostridium stercorarium subsp. lept